MASNARLSLVESPLLAVARLAPGLPGDGADRVVQAIEAGGLVGAAARGRLMPIKPENRARYPQDWDAISAGIRARAGDRCECEGECGRRTHHERCPNRQGHPAYGTGSTVVLTTAHLNHTPEDCSDENLRSMCQGCHLHYDRKRHAGSRRRTFEQRTGQQSLLATEEHP